MPTPLCPDTFHLLDHTTNARGTRPPPPSTYSGLPAAFFGAHSLVYAPIALGESYSSRQLQYTCTQGLWPGKG